ncbi:mitochondrial mRNA pseudouridine synthase TRUB2 isoform X2 [Ochotona curzoniae]|uniref:mitochondrial mRNA pseudouridine synthase TRUB2 isoform X2 n=1 Tax=Ochotona curzoniae TaxID=130825 RepID=UPI001B34A336|nr:mitochondrial mRNA pseudouridine synthase TRUB2 isoform X2 [Ochotona curzoniae]
MGSSAVARLHGLFAAYKPPGLKWEHLRDTVELQLLRGLNAGKAPAPQQRVRFLLGPTEGSEDKGLTLTATSVPTLTRHPLVCGPAFTSLKIGVGHRLDAQASGVLVLGVGHGCRLLTDMHDAHLTKDYTLRGLLGKATDDFCEDGRLVEKTTYDHVTREKLDRILAVIQGSHQKALVIGAVHARDAAATAKAGARDRPGAQDHCRLLTSAAHAGWLLCTGRCPPAVPVGPPQHPGGH